MIETAQVQRIEPNVTVSLLGRGILHGDSLWLELKVSYSSLDTTTTNPIVWIVKMTIEYLLGQGERPVEPLPYFSQVVHKCGIGWCYRRAWFFRGRCVGCERSKWSRRCPTPQDRPEGHGCNLVSFNSSVCGWLGLSDVPDACSRRVFWTLLSFAHRPEKPFQSRRRGPIRDCLTDSYIYQPDTILTLPAESPGLAIPVTMQWPQAWDVDSCIDQRSTSMLWSSC
jgi:hypothetical protein